MSRHRDSEAKAPDFIKELREGTWLQNARGRKQYQKSKWNNLVMALALPIYLGAAYGLIVFAIFLRNLLHPGHVGPPLAYNNVVAGTCVVFAPLVASIFIAFVGANFLVYQIPPARRAFDKEAEAMPSIGYSTSQRALLKIGVPTVLITVVLLIIAAVIG
jgi:heme/copper-type cytochrome/quinol oxidase subunit 2